MSACSGKKAEEVEIEDKNFSSVLVIQKVVDNASSDDLQKTVKDKHKIKKILTMVEELDVTETDTDEMTEALKSQDSYSFSFTEGDKWESGKPTPYFFVILNDGTFFFTHKDINSIQQPRMSIKKHKELLNEMKQLLKVDF